MKFTLNNLKRKLFFRLDKLQVTRKERTGITLLFLLLILLFSLNQVLQQTYNYSQEEYDAILKEFKKKSALIQKEEAEQLKKYYPPLSVNEMVPEKQVPDQPESKDTETTDYSAQRVLNSEQQTPPSRTEPDSGGLVNINTAGLNELQTLKGIGATYAQRIIDYRLANGDFNSIEELLNVKGIGKKRLENIRPFIKL